MRTDCDLPLHTKIICAGVAGCSADVASYPLDTVKVWQQINGEKSTKSIPMKKNSLSSMKTIKSTTKNSTRTIVSKAMVNTPIVPFHQSVRRAVATMLTLPPKGSVFAGTPKLAFPQPSPKSIAGTMLKVVQSHGVKGLYSGLPAGLQRQLGFCSVRIGLYDNIKGFYLKLLPASDTNSKNVGHSILAGCTTGFIAVGLFQPTEVVKIRMQANGGKSTLDAYRSLFKNGLHKGWQGFETNCARMMVVNVCELVTYDYVKTTLLQRKIMKDALPCHMSAALISGFMTTLVASPIDVVKTRYMNSKTGTYKSPIQCAAQMLAKEGYKAFYKGFWPSYLRIGSWNMLMFVGYEQYKRICSDTYKLLNSDLAVHYEEHPYYEHAMFQSLLECGPIA